MVYTINEWFIELLGEPGDQGHDGTATTQPGLFGSTTATDGGDPPTGAVLGDLVFNTDTGVIYQVISGPGGKLVLTQHPSIVAPNLPVGLHGPTGATGPDGGMAPHTHGSVTLDYTPRIYEEMWHQSYIPIKPLPPVVDPDITLTTGIGNTVKVKIPAASGSISHPYPAEAPDKPPLPMVDLSRLRVVVTRGKPTPESPWLGTNRVDYVDVMSPMPEQTVIASLTTAWPASATDDLWVTAYLWDIAGNGPVASLPVKVPPANVVWKPPTIPDRLPPQQPKIVIRWDPTTRTYTITVTAPPDGDVQEVRIWENLNSNLPTTEGITPRVIKLGPGQTYTYTLTPNLNMPTSLPNGLTWEIPAGQLPHGPIFLGLYGVAIDANQNAGDPMILSDYQQGTPYRALPTIVPPIAKPPVITGPPGGGGGGGGAVVVGPGGTVLPPVGARPQPQQRPQVPFTIPHQGMTRGKSRAYDQKGSRADNQWGAGVMHTGYYGSNHGVQWGGAYVNLSQYKGATIDSMTLHFRTTHTFLNSGADICLGVHKYPNGMPNTLTGNTSRASFGALGHIHVPKSGAVSVKIPDAWAQRFLDGDAYGFLFGGPHDHTNASYAAIDIDSVWVEVKMLR